MTALYGPDVMHQLTDYARVALKPLCTVPAACWPACCPLQCHKGQQHVHLHPHQRWPIHLRFMQVMVQLQTGGRHTNTQRAMQQVS